MGTTSISKARFEIDNRRYIKTKCFCGCGIEINQYKFYYAPSIDRYIIAKAKFIRGHNALKGIPRTQEVKEKVRQSVLRWHKKVGHSQKTKDKIRQSMQKHIKKLSDIHKGELNPAKRLDVRKKMSLAQRGEKSIRWKGGITELYSAIRGLWEYKEWHKQIRERDNWNCQICGSHGGKIEVDHIIPLYEMVMRYNIKTIDDARECKEIWDINNGRTLCQPCHKKTDTYGKYIK